MRGEGIAPEAIDAALVAFSMPMGPTELADTVRLDVAVHIGSRAWPYSIAAFSPGADNSG